MLRLTVTTLEMRKINRLLRQVAAEVVAVEEEVEVVDADGVTAARAIRPSLARPKVSTRPAKTLVLTPKVLRLQSLRSPRESVLLVAKVVAVGTRVTMSMPRPLAVTPPPPPRLRSKTQSLPRHHLPP
jgi:hypothetical protein